MSKGDKAKGAQALAVPGASVPLLAQMPKPLQQYIEQTLGKLHQELQAGNTDTAWAAAERGLQMEVAGKILAGAALVELRNSLAPGDFSAGLAARHMPRSSAYRAIDVYKLFSTLSDAKVVPALGQLGETKLLALAAWSPTEIEAFGSGKEVRGLTIEQTVEMPSREFAEAIKSRDDEISRLQGQSASLQEHLTAARSQLDQVKTAAALRAQKSGLPAFAFAARQELAAASDTIDVALDLFLENIVALADEAKKDRVHGGIVAGSAYHLLNAIDARVQQLQERLSKYFPAECSAEPAGFAMEPGEAEGAIQAREVILGRLRDASHDRAAERANTAEGRVGRKRKTSAEKKAR